METVYYWRGTDSWPFSIEEDPESRNGVLESIEVSENEIYTKKGKRYYNLQCGHGTNIKLLVQNIKEKEEMVKSTSPVASSPKPVSKKVEVEEVEKKELYVESVKNDQNGQYFLVMPLFFSYQDKIFLWDRTGNGYAEITLEKFLEETHPR